MMTRLAAMMAGAMLVMAGSAQFAGAVDYRVISSRIFDGAQYDGRSRTLTLVFEGGATYAFYEVPREVYLDFIRIVNPGEYFNRHIRKAYRYERLDRYPAAWAARE